MQRLQQTLMRPGGIVALLFGMVWLGARPASAHGAVPHAHFGISETRQCSAGTPVLANFQSRLYLAWTGCDAQHHLNIESSTDGFNWVNKITLTNTAMDGTGPALVPYNNHLYIDWAGTDGNKSENVAYFNGGVSLLGKVTFPESAGGGDVGMTVGQGELWLAAFCGGSCQYGLRQSTDCTHWRPYQFAKKVTSDAPITA
jgi:hypothetical protein